ncbi:MAG TPA: phosphatase PAP2 family protein, partial [Gemmatimonadales bacterium]|nr:phosphatase PAP2 family protein [Gemmatimonadales bacterium]
TDATITASRAGVPASAGLGSSDWLDLAITAIAQANTAPTNAARPLALVSVAQYLSLQEAEAAAGGTDEGATGSGSGLGRGGRARLETDRGAVAGASAVVLSFLFPNRAQAIEDMVAAQAHAVPGGIHPAFTAGEAIGRAVGAQIVTRAQNDRFSQPFPGTIPTGPGLWISNTNPATVAGGNLPGAQPWFLTSASQFRPGLPPAVGSAAFTADLQEIRALSDGRTAAQIQTAAFWALNAGTPTASGFWIQFATNEIKQRGLSEREATHVYAVISTTMADALIGCWDAKMTYWYIRPWQADPGITTTAAVGRPNHPSYPSGHSCVSASAGEVLSTFFPDKRAQVEAMVAEAGLSRMYGGIHYRFDIVAGQELGRNVARYVIEQDASGTSVLTPH